MGVLSFRRVFEVREHLPDAHERLLAIGGAIELDADAVEDVASARPSSSPKLSAASAGSSPGASGTTFTSKPSTRGQLHAAQRRRLSCRVRVEAQIQTPGQPLQLRELPFGERGAHRRHHRLEPAWRSAIASVLPSTTIARSSFAIAWRARCSP